MKGTFKNIFSSLLLLIIAYLFVYNFDSIVSFVKELAVSEPPIIIHEEDTNDIVEEIPEEKFNFDAEYYIYYKMLNENEKKLYRQLYSHAKVANKVFKPVVPVNKAVLNKVYEYVYNDHPELFWLSTSYSYKYNQNGICVEVTIGYNETINSLDKNILEFNNVVDSIVKDAYRYKSNYEREKYVHDYLVKLIEYDTNALVSQSAYSALVNHKTVCAGYARAFQLIMTKLRIPTYYVVGYAKINHAWNIVMLDREYYNVDVTWDDTGNTNNYFNRTDSEFDKTHKRLNSSINLPKCTGIKYGYYRKVVLP